VEGRHPGILRVSHSEYRDLDPVWKETDEGGKDCPVNDVGKGSVGTYQVVSFFSKERSADRQSYGPWFPWHGEKSMTPLHKARLGNRPLGADPVSILGLSVKCQLVSAARIITCVSISYDKMIHVVLLG
jgi:hypothetical protein